MKHIFNTIQESLMDDEDEIFASAGSNLIRDWFSAHAKGAYKIRILKNGNIKVTGDMVIKGFPEQNIPSNIHIEDVNGSLKIEKCPNLINIEDLFVEYTTVKGDFSISNCPKLTSLKGCPFTVKGNAYIVGNSSLKSLDGMPQFIYNEVYVMKNGKKFSEQVIASYVSIPDRIVCSEESETPVINEAMNEPHLLKLAQQLKNSTIGGNKYSFRDIFGPGNDWWHKPIKGGVMNVDVAFDEIDSTNVTVYRHSTDADAQKAIRRIISKDNFGLILFTDYSGEYMFCVTSSKQYRILSDNYNTYDTKAKSMWVGLSYSSIMDKMGSAWGVVIIEWKHSEIGGGHLSSKRNVRKTSREGMILNTPEQNEELARSNFERYKKMAAQIRAQKDESFIKVDQAVENIIKKVLDVSKDAKAHPQKYSSYRISGVLQMIYGDSHWVGYSRSNKTGVTGEDGLLKMYANYTSAYMNVAGDGGYEYQRRELDTLKNKIFKHVLEIDDKLKLCKA